MKKVWAGCFLVGLIFYIVTETTLAAWLLWAGAIGMFFTRGNSKQEKYSKHHFVK